MVDSETITRRGRVVYTRKRHYFKPKDLNRVFRSIRKNYLVSSDMESEDLVWLKATFNEMQRFLFPNKELTEKEALTPEEKADFKTFLSGLSIDLLVEIIEKIPFVPQRTERRIAEYIYWNLIYLIDELIYGIIKKE